ncbi:hypothetical protein BGW39_009435 [Mortierella sp. 14UC]|nr:hypothetical protein BGW39_009435 [Mortierella sp. 14UC]
MLLRTQPNSPVCDAHGSTTDRKASAGEGEGHQRDVQLKTSVDHHRVSSTTEMNAEDQKAECSTSHDHDHRSNNNDSNYNDSNNHEFKKQKTTGPVSPSTAAATAKDVMCIDGEVGKRSVERLSTPDRGRIMVARSRIPKGTFLYRITPQAIVCDSESRTRRCAGCLKRLGSKGLKRKGDVGAEGEVETSGRCASGWGCMGCGEIWYCDQVCAKWDWEALHAAECRFLQALYQGVPDDDNNSDRQNEDEDEMAWMSTVGTPYRKAIVLFSQSFEPYTQDYCRLLIRILTHRFRELADPCAGQQGVHSDDPPYLMSPNVAPGPGPLPYAEVEDLVANQSSFARDRIEGEFGDVVQVLDAFQTHLEVYYLPRQYLHHQQHRHGHQQGTVTVTATGTGMGAAAAPRRLLQTELLDLIMREECNSFGYYEYPLLPSNHTTTTTLEGNNSKQGYALCLHLRQHIYGFNHSCSPNLFHVAHNHQLLFYAGRDILPGEEINIAYLEFGPYYRLPPPAGAPTGAGVEGTASEEGEEGEGEGKKRREAFETRTQFLKDYFYFDCGCPRCTYESALYSSSENNNNAVRARAMREGLSAEEDRFLREGLSCERGGCYGFYAPPAVLRARQDDDNSNNEEDDRWGCVACGYRQS